MPENGLRDKVVSTLDQPTAALITPAQVKTERDLGEIRHEGVVELDTETQPLIQWPPSRFVECPGPGIEEQRIVGRIDLESHSGANALRALVAPLSRNGRFFASVQISGTHLDSIAALTNGQADVAAIDCVTYSLLDRYRPSVLARTRQLCFTPLAPGVPYVTRAGTEEKLAMDLQRALVEAFEDAEVQAACESIFIDGIVVLPPSTYTRIAELERFAVAQGYPELR